MGRGDGTGRIVSPEGADDTGTGILHVDMDAFFAAVEVLDDPSLRGRPVIVGGVEGRGVVSSATYEARRFGVRSAMPMGQALRLCPTRDRRRPAFRSVCRGVQARDGDLPRVHTAASSRSRSTRPSSMCAAPVGCGGVPGRSPCSSGSGSSSETGLTCSVGVAATKHVAKIASTHQQARRAVDRGRTRHGGVPRRAAGPRALGNRPEGGRGARVPRHPHRRRRARHAPVRPRSRPRTGDGRPDLAPRPRPRCSTLSTRRRVEKSVGHEETFDSDIDDPAVLRSELRRLADRVGGRLRTHGWVASTISIKLRFADFTTLSRSQTLAEPTSVGQRIGDAAIELFDAVERPLPVRLVGVRGEKLRQAQDGDPDAVG